MLYMIGTQAKVILLPLSSSSILICIFTFRSFYFSVILEKTIRMPRSVSVKAASMLKGFLNKVGSFFLYTVDASQPNNKCLIPSFEYKPYKKNVF